MPDLFPVTREDMIAEVRREIELRERVYPRWVSAGRLKAERAARQIEVMKAVLATLKGAPP